MLKTTKKSVLITVIWLTVFAIAMGFLESIVVVYIRKLYYPQGFHFPLSREALNIIGYEWLRELTTIIMLLSVAVLAGKELLMRIAFFLISFAVWDISYYVGLKLFLDWPESLLTWDVLFLIPVTWIGPVLAPLICSLTMLILAGTLITLRQVGIRSLKPLEWGLLLSGTAIIFVAFIWDYAGIIIREGYLLKIWALLDNQKTLQKILNHEPIRFVWYVFGCGEAAVLSTMGLILLRIRGR